MKLSNTLIKELEKEQVDEVKKILAESHVLVNLLRTVVDKKIKNVRTNREKKAEYDVSNWAYKQADANGEIRGLHFLLDILPEL